MKTPVASDATRAAFQAGEITLGEAFDRANIESAQIPVESWLTPEDAREKYASTWVWDMAVILAQVAGDAELRKRVEGQSWHVGGGQWLAVCGDCEKYTITYGAMPIYRTIGPHMVAEHGALVGGINVGMLP